MGVRREFYRRHGLALLLWVGLVGAVGRADDAPTPPIRDDRAAARPWRPRLLARFVRRRRLQEATEDRSRPAPPSGGEAAPSAGTPGGLEAPGPTELSVPFAERGIGGATPTLEEQEEMPPTPQPSPSLVPPAPTPLYLNRALGLEDSPVRLYGWLQNSFTGNADGTPADRSNFSVFPNRLANQWHGNQYYLVLENPIEPTDMVELGFRFDTLFGNDWQFTKSYGLFDNAFANNHFAGLDFPQIYGEIHLPILTPGGLDLKGGRFYSLAGYEAVPAISRPLLSVPYTFNFTPFTFVGLFTTLHLTDRVNLFNGTINGWDRWIDRNYKWGYIGGFTWKSRDEKTNITFIGSSVPDQLPRYAPANSPFVPTGTITPPGLGRLPNPFYANNPRGYTSLVVTHQWTERLAEAVQTDHVWEQKVLGFSLNGQPSSMAYHSFAHWFLYAFTDKVTGVWRSEVFWDPYGCRHRQPQHLLRDHPGLPDPSQALALVPPGGPLRLVAVQPPVRRRDPLQPTDIGLRRDPPLLKGRGRETLGASPFSQSRQRTVEGGLVDEADTSPAMAGLAILTLGTLAAQAPRPAQEPGGLEAPGSTDLSVPRAERGIGAATPTPAEERPVLPANPPSPGTPIPPFALPAPLPPPTYTITLGPRHACVTPCHRNRARADGGLIEVLVPCARHVGRHDDRHTGRRQLPRLHLLGLADLPAGPGVRDPLLGPRDRGGRPDARQQPGRLRPQPSQRRRLHAAGPRQRDPRERDQHAAGPGAPADVRLGRSGPPVQPTPAAAAGPPDAARPLRPGGRLRAGYDRQRPLQRPRRRRLLPRHRPAGRLGPDPRPLPGRLQEVVRIHPDAHGRAPGRRTAPVGPRPGRAHAPTAPRSCALTLVARGPRRLRTGPTIGNP